MTVKFYSEKKKKILELDTRKKIYNIVEKNAGCHFREIERKAKIPGSSVRYHLHYLAKNDIIKEKRDGKNLRYFPEKNFGENEILLGLLRQKSIRTILLSILYNKNKKNTNENIVRFTQLSPATVSWYIKKLIEKRIISVNKKGRKSEYSLKIKEKDIINLLMQYKESFLDTLVNSTIEMWDLKFGRNI